MGAKGLGSGGFELRWNLEVIWFSIPSSPHYRRGNEARMARKGGRALPKVTSRALSVGGQI